MSEEEARQIMLDTMRTGQKMTGTDLRKATTGALTRFGDQTLGRLGGQLQEKESDLMAWYEAELAKSGVQFDNFGRVSDFGEYAKGTEEQEQDYFFDPRRGFGEGAIEGSAEADLYNLLLQSQQEQYAEQKRVMDRQEADLFKGIQADRRSTMEDIRNRRRGQLKSGLTQSQIANQEMSSMLQAQQLANMNRGQFQQQRGQADIYNTGGQQQARAAQDLYGIAQGFNTPGSAFYAASTQDPISQAQRYQRASQGSPGFVGGYEQVTGQNQDRR